MGEEENRCLKGRYYRYTATDANLEQKDLKALYDLYQQVKNIIIKESMNALSIYIKTIKRVK